MSSAGISITGMLVKIYGEDPLATQSRRISGDPDPMDFRGNAAMKSYDDDSLWAVAKNPAGDTEEAGEKYRKRSCPEALRP